MTVENTQEASASEDVWTIKRLLDWTKDFFVKYGSESPRLDAEILLAEALECSRIDLYTRFGETPDPEPLAKYRDWVKRHAAGEPVAYLVGHREFYSLRFNVNSSVLIPRPETEHVVVQAIEFCKTMDRSPIRIADIGTGSGCVGITLASQLEHAEVCLTDLSPEALAVAEENAEQHDLSDRIEFVESDLFAALDGRQFELIVSNPPYIGTAEVDTVDENVRKYEPEMALFSGEQGTDLIRQMVAEAPKYLSAEGALIFETSPIVMDACLQLVVDNGAYDEPQVVKDLAGHRRVVIAKLRSLSAED